MRGRVRAFHLRRGRVSLCRQRRGALLLLSDLAMKRRELHRQRLALRLGGKALRVSGTQLLPRTRGGGLVRSRLGA